MSEEEFIFRQDVREKKATGRSARNRVSRSGSGSSVRFPSDNLTKKEKFAMNGTVTTYKINAPMTWAYFQSLPDDIKIAYITLLREQYDPTDGTIASMLGVSKSYFSKTLRELGLAKGANASYLSGRNFKSRDWRAWLTRGYATDTDIMPDNTNKSTSEEFEEDAVDAECVACDDVPTEESPKPAPEEVLTAKELPSSSRKAAFTSNGEVTFMGDFEKSLNAVLLLTNGVKGNAKISWESSKTHGEISFAGELDGFAQTLLKLLADDSGTLSVSWTSQPSSDAT